MDSSGAIPAHRPAPDLADWPIGADVRLVVADMDGTLLDGDSQIPRGLWPLLAEMRARGIVFAPASGRQYATLASMFAREADGMTIIAENGALAMRDEVEVSSAPIDPETVVSVVRAEREHARSGADVGVVVCAKTAAYVERTDERFLEQARPYYRRIVPVPDAVGEEVLAEGVVKVALYDFGNVEASVPAVFGRSRHSHQVVISGEHWSDLMTQGVDKGTAVRDLQDLLRIGADQTVVFGDFLNDLGMIQASGLSFAMANAHPDLIAAANHIAPANTEDGVVTVLRALLGLTG